MAYQKQNFVPGQKLKASQLNHMEEGIAAALEQGGAGSYIFTGNYDGDYNVVLNSDASWDSLVEALRANKHVLCVLWDEDRLYPKYLTPSEICIEDGYVVFSAMGEGGYTYQMIYYSGNEATLASLKFTIGGTITELLWQNIDPTGEFESQSIYVPHNAYDFVEIVHWSGDASTEASTRIATDGLCEGGLTLTMAGVGLYATSRGFRLIPNSHNIEFSKGWTWRIDPDGTSEHYEDDTACVPFRIYGIKGVDKTKVEGEFTIGGSPYKFVRGWKWGDWVYSKYNQQNIKFKNNVVVSGSEMYKLVLDAGETAKYSDLIVDGGEYNWVSL